MRDIVTTGVPKEWEQGVKDEVALPREMTPLYALGAIMAPIVISHDWTSKQLMGPCAGIKLPSKEDVISSLFMPQQIMDGARDYLSYECHDLRICKIDNDGKLSVLICKRVEPKSNLPEGEATAPINGFWWSVGGRREIAAPGTSLYGKFDFVDSVLRKANKEAGVIPDNVLGVYDLGVGRTEFPKEMTYVSVGPGSNGERVEDSKKITLQNPQNTINRNIVLIVSSDSVVADQTVEHLIWMGEDDYQDPQTRAQFCEYERAFLDALFDGNREAKIKGRNMV